MMILRRILVAFCFFFSLIPLIDAQAFPDRHSTNLEEGWLSCQTSANPNPARGTGHWIRYDLGDTYALQTSKIWNFNTPQRINSYNNQSNFSTLTGRLQDGMKDVIIDISINGTSWQEWGRFSIPMATGSSFYEGVFGPDFGGKIARYVLITGLTNHGGTCYGLSEIKINGSAATVSSVVDPLEHAAMEVSPNPFNENTTVRLINFPNGNIKLTLTDLNGKEIFVRNININNELAEIPVSGSGLTSGFYLLNAYQNGASKSVKIEVIK